METKKPRAPRKKTSKHSVIGRAYRFPLEPSAPICAKLFCVKDLCWEARNLLVADRAADRATQRAAIKVSTASAASTTRTTAGAALSPAPTPYLTRADQYVRLALLAKADRRYQAVHSQVLQNVACRVDEGTKRWLDACKSNKGVGRKESAPRRVSPPGPIDKKDYKSFTFSQYGSAAYLRRSVLHLSKIGDIPVRDYRRMRGKPKTVTIKFEDGRWWAVIVCEIQAADVFRSAAQLDQEHLPDTGVDPGLSALIATAHGQVFDPPKALKLCLKQLRHANKDMSRKFAARKAQYTQLAQRVQQERSRCSAAGEPLPPAPPSLRETPYPNRLKRQIKVVAKLHTKVKNTRRHYHQKIARTMERTYRCVAVEEHGLQFMLQNRKLARATADRGIYAQKQALKAVLGARYVPAANRRAGIGGNSQTCLCDALVPKTLKDRIHHCPACGLVAPRDVVSANIVMKIAFGTAVLAVPVHEESSPAAGLAVVIRGETEGGATQGVDEHASFCAKPAGRGTSRAAEVSVKRNSLASTRQTNTGEGEPVPEAKNTAHRKRKLPLSVAVQFVCERATRSPLEAPSL